MQCFVVSLGILLLISQKYTWKKRILGSVALLPCLSLGYVTYVERFNAVHEGSNEVQRHSSRHDAYLDLAFTQWHTNFGCYLLGMITAFIYEWVKSSNADLKRLKLFTMAWKLHYPVLGLLFITSYTFQTFKFARPSWWMVVTAVCYRNLWGVLVGVTILGYKAGLGGTVRDFLTCKLFQLLGRTVFAFYVVHMIAVKIVVGQTMYPLHLSMSYATFTIVLSVVLSFFFAMALHVLIEIPISNLQSKEPSEKLEMNNNLVPAQKAMYEADKKDT